MGRVMGGPMERAPRVLLLVQGRGRARRSCPPFASSLALWCISCSLQYMFPWAHKDTKTCSHGPTNTQTHDMQGLHAFPDSSQSHCAGLVPPTWASRGIPQDNTMINQQPISTRGPGRGHPASLQAITNNDRG